MFPNPKRIRNLDRLLQAVLEEGQPLETALQDPACQKDAQLARLLREEAEIARRFQSHSAQIGSLPASVASGRQRLEAQIRSQRKDWKGVFTRSRLAWNTGMAVLVLLMLASAARIVGQGRHIMMVAMPGDLQYFLKIAVEQVNLDLAVSTEDELRVYLQIAHNRAMEFESLILEERFEFLPQTLAGFESALGRARALQNNISGELPADIQTSLADLEHTVNLQLVMLLYFAPPMAAELRPDIERVAWLNFGSHFGDSTP